MLKLFAEHEYGSPLPKLEPVKCEVVESGEAFGGKGIRRQVRLTFEAGGQSRSALILIYLPKQTAPAPVFLCYNFKGNHTTCRDPKVIPSLLSQEERGAAEGRWSYEMILDAGYGVVTAHYWDFYPDSDSAESLAQSILPLFGFNTPEDIAETSTQSIGAWAWGYSRIMDYLETCSDIDSRKVALMGHSRLGKTALWTGAIDARFAAVISNESGCSGAAISRRCYGERIYRITHSFPHWFCPKYMSYGYAEEKLPMDQHELLALIAPRPLYVASAREDRWSDPRGEFLGLQGAAEVYGLYGISFDVPEGYLAEDQPACERPIIGHLGYHLRSGKHDVTPYDWTQYIKFLDKVLK